MTIGVLVMRLMVVWVMYVIVVALVVTAVCAFDPPILVRGVRIRHLATWRRRLEGHVPFFKYLRPSTTEEKERARLYKAIKADMEAQLGPPPPPITPVVKKFQRICGAVDALQEIENNLNIKRANRFGVTVPERSDWGSPDAYRDGYIRESEKMARRIGRQKDRLVWWLVRHGVDPTDLNDIVVSVSMVERIAKRFAIKSDSDDPCKFEGEIHIDPASLGPQAWGERQKLIFEARDKQHEAQILEGLQFPGDQDRPAIQVDDVWIPIEIIRAMAGGPFYTVDGVVCALWPRPNLDPVELDWPHRPRPAMTYRQTYIFVPKTTILEAITKYPSKA